ncbi:hypothetical protein ACKKBG_A36655 [Auxenochlorella protothecoides x Auxenochlorella symbiontica]
MWEYALQATGLNLKLEGDTDISSLFIPLDDFTLQCHSAVECGQLDSYWRGELTTPTHFGLLLLHWTLSKFSSRMIFPSLDGDSYVADTMLEAVLGNTTGNNEWKLAAKMTNSRVASVSVVDNHGNAKTAPSGVVATYSTCSGTLIYVIQQPMSPSNFPNMNATRVPGLQKFCWRSLWSAGFQVPYQVTVNNDTETFFRFYSLRYLSLISYFTGKYPELHLNLDLAQPTTNVTLLIPADSFLAEILAIFEEIPSEEYRRAHTVMAHFFIDGGRCLGSSSEGRWIPTLAASHLGQNLSLLVTPGSKPDEIQFRTSLQPDKPVPAKFLASGCYSTIYALDGVLPLWTRWQDIPPSEPNHFPRVEQDLLFGVNPTCRTGDALIGRYSGLDQFVEGPAPSKSTGLSAGAIVGIVMGSLAAALALAYGLLLVGRHANAQQLFHKVWFRPRGYGEQGAERPANTSSKGDTSRQACNSLQASPRRVFSYRDFENGIMQPSDFSFDLAPGTHERVRLGSGRYGQVFAGRLLNGEPVAIKCVRGPSPGAPLQLVSEGCLAEEARILKHCRSVYVVSFVGMAVDHTAGELYLLTQRMVGGDLHGAIRKRRVAWKDGGWRIALDIARGLVYLASKRIVHNDLKSSNVLLDGEGRAKISDVGLAKMLPGSKSYPGVITAGGGSFHWCAPETILGLPCTPQADIFSLGVVMWELATGESPIRGGMRLLRSPDECPPNIAHLVESCWERKPDDRPTATQVVESLLKEHGSDQYDLGA